MHDLSELFKAPQTVALKKKKLCPQSLHVWFRITRPPQTHSHTHTHTLSLALVFLSSMF